MKRFLSLLTVFMLAFSLAIPVGASSVCDGHCPLTDTNFDNVCDICHGEITLDSYFVNIEINGVPMAPIPWIELTGYPYVVITHQTIGNATYFSAFANKPVEWSDGDDGYYVGTPDGTTNDYLLFKLGYDDGEGLYQWESVESGTTKTIHSDNIIYSSYQISFNEYCDGSSCPATDANVDGICDDCGATLMSLSRTPVAPAVDGSNKNYVMFYSGTVYKYTAYTSDESYTIRGEEYGTRYRTYTDPSVTVQRFESYDGINWEQTYSGKTANDYPGEVGYELISSTFDWYTEEGEHFFPVPLWEEVQSVTQGEMGNLTAETAGTMKVLVVCGVGLMALLVVLSLFGRRSLLFLR